MPSQLWQDFIGGFYQTRSPLQGCDVAVNIYTEAREVKGSPKQTTIYGTPGLTLRVTLPTNGSRGEFTQDGQTWAVYGDTLYEIDTDAWTGTSRGTIPDDGFPVSFVSNGDAGEQLGIVGGGELNVLDLQTNVLATVVLPFSDPVMIVFQDGYGLINQANSPIVWFSNLEDLETWDALDFFTRNASSDNVVGLAVTRDRVWVFGTKTSTQYYDSGNADNPWQPYPGTTLQVGAVTPWAISVYADVIRFLARSPKGEARIAQAKADASITTISTPPIADFLAACSTLDDAEMVATYEQAGHPFIVLTCPSSPAEVKSYHFDILETLWGARAAFVEGAGGNGYDRWRVRGCTATGQQILVGDFENGNLYTLDLDTNDDNGDLLVRDRIAPFLSAENQWLFIDQIELGTQAGVGLASGDDTELNPAVELLISRDGGHTYISAGVAYLGALGQFLTRPIWRRLGRARADRLVIRLRQSAAVPCIWGPGLWITAEGGSGQL